MKEWRENLLSLLLYNLLLFNIPLVIFKFFSLSLLNIFNLITFLLFLLIDLLLLKLLLILKILGKKFSFVSSLKMPLSSSKFLKDKDFIIQLRFPLYTFFLLLWTNFIFLFLIWGFEIIGISFLKINFSLWLVKGLLFGNITKLLFSLFLRLNFIIFGLNNWGTLQLTPIEILWE